jgi:hypothetical protein
MILMGDEIRRTQTATTMLASLAHTAAKAGIIDSAACNGRARSWDSRQFDFAGVVETNQTANS